MTNSYFKLKSFEENVAPTGFNNMHVVLNNKQARKPEQKQQAAQE
jgi:hypothetical protein